jgi:hypothetical protein
VAITNGVLANFFPQRTGILLNQFTARGWLQSLAAPEFNHYGGEVTSGFDLTITKPAGSPGSAEIYYTTDDTDPRLVGGAVNPSAAHSAGPVSIEIETAKRIKARIKNGSDWSALIDAVYTLPDLFPVRITELHYHPADHPGVTDPNDLEFIEIMNTGSTLVNLAGVQIAQFAAEPYTFGSGVNLAAGDRLIVARNPAIFQLAYGTGINLAPIGYAGANLSNGGERIKLVGPFGETLQDFTYHDSAPWPTSPDGDGHSLEIIDPLGDPTSAANWRASAARGGSPGTSGAPSIPGDYDGNGTVEHGDFDRWKSTFGSTTIAGASADGNGNGTVDAADYVVWRKNSGASQAGGTSIATRDDSLDQNGAAIASTNSVELESPPTTAIPPPRKSFAAMSFDSNFISKVRGRHSLIRRSVLAESVDGNELLAYGRNANSIALTIDQLAISGSWRRIPQKGRCRLDSIQNLDCAVVDSALGELGGPEVI